MIDIGNGHLVGSHTATVSFGDVVKPPYDRSVPILSLALIAKLAHVLLAMGLVAGMVGRTLALRQARAVDDIGSFAQLARLAGTFDARLVIPCSQLVLLLGLVTAWLQGWPILGFLVGGSSSWVLVSLVLFGVIVVLVPAVFLPAGRRFDAALERALADGAVTPSLRTALDDRSVRWAHRAEAGLIAGIVVLMVLKPF